jgi:hypothetical protein
LATQPFIDVFVCDDGWHSDLGHGWGLVECRCVCGRLYFRVGMIQAIAPSCPYCGLGGGNVQLAPDGHEPASDGPWLTGQYSTENIHGRG